MLELITDRTQAHVDLLKRLRKKPEYSMDSSEKTQWLNVAAKGAYNYSDLNRVETAVGVLSEMMGLNLVTKTNWTLLDRPTRSDMSRYLGNVAKIREACATAPDMPQLPDSMDNLTYKDANNIEKVLLVAYETYETIASTWIRSGEIYSGEV